MPLVSRWWRAPAADRCGERRVFVGDDGGAGTLGGECLDARSRVVGRGRGDEEEIAEAPVEERV